MVSIGYFNMEKRELEEKYIGFRIHYCIGHISYRHLSNSAGSGEFGPFTIRPSGIFGEFGLLVGEFGPLLGELG